MLSQVCACGRIPAIAATSSARTALNGISTVSTSEPAAGSRALPVTNLMNLRLCAGAHPSSTAHSASRSGAHCCSSSSITTRNVCCSEKSSFSSAQSATEPQTAAASWAGVKSTACSCPIGSACEKPRRNASNCQLHESTRSRRSAASTYCDRVTPGVSSSSTSAAKSASLILFTACSERAASGSNSTSVAMSASKSAPPRSLRNSSSGSCTCKVVRLHRVCPATHPAKRSSRATPSSRCVAVWSNQWWRASGTYGSSGGIFAGSASHPRSICCPISANSSLRGPWPSPLSHPPVSCEKKRGNSLHECPSGPLAHEASHCGSASHSAVCLPQLSRHCPSPLLTKSRYTRVAFAPASSTVHTWGRCSPNSAQSSDHTSALCSSDCASSTITRRNMMTEK
mmetsp:Transcript_21491/g.51632  ORF Transcript_21491/g.51632 Transcript_21491/m.51632 type:complete len:398 (-) Transcript_21491:76-1269(-)